MGGGGVKNEENVWRILIAAKQFFWKLNENYKKITEKWVTC